MPIRLPWHGSVPRPFASSPQQWHRKAEQEDDEKHEAYPKPQAMRLTAGVALLAAEFAGDERIVVELVFRQIKSIMA